MTIIFSLVPLLLFLSLQLHACNARNLEVLPPNHEKSQWPITKEKDEKVNGGCVPMQPGERKKSEIEAKSDDQQKNFEVMKDDGVINGSDFRKKWRVPHRKRGDKEAAGFNLDYLPPRTHPPVHN